MESVITFVWKLSPHLNAGVTVDTHLPVTEKHAQVKQYNGIAITVTIAHELC